MKTGNGERLCVVMPVYNEEAAIGPVLRKWHEALVRAGIDFEIRAYNDGSRDGSLAAMRETAAVLGDRITIRDKPNEGHGPTILRAYREAIGFDWIFQIDSDDEMGPEMFTALWDARHDRDFIVGRRDGRRQAWPRKTVSLVSRLAVRIFYGKSVWDVNAPYRLMRVSAFAKLFTALPPDTFAPNVILSGFAAHEGLRLLEIPVPQHDRRTGEVSIKKGKLLKAAAKSFAQTLDCAPARRKGFFSLALLSLLSLFLAVGGVLLEKTIAMLYAGTCPIASLNCLLAGQDVHPLSHYLDYFGSFYKTFAVGIFVILAAFLVWWSLGRWRERIWCFLSAPRGWLVFAFLAVLSTVMKYHASRTGWNFDFESYEIVADIVNAGGNVYAETYRYNYGPIWFIILGMLKALLGNGFRQGIIALLSMADIGIGALLWKKRLFAATLIFLLSNVSIHISGYHNQFDNMAVAIALLALSLLDANSSGGLRQRVGYWTGIILLGVSITLKHVFVFFPFWFLFAKTSWRRRIASCVLPIGMFLASFVPYSGLTAVAETHAVRQVVSDVASSPKEDRLRTAVASCRQRIQPLPAPTQGIRNHVFLYRSFPNGQFYGFFLPRVLVDRVGRMPLWFAAMLLLGWLFARRPWFQKGLVYALGMFVFSPAVTVQYYAIPAAAAAVYWSPFGLAYHFMVSSVLHINDAQLNAIPKWDILSIVLLVGCLCKAFRTDIKDRG